MDLRRYSIRHDAVLEVIASFVKKHLPYYFISIDSPSNIYHHITPTDLRPDILWWSDKKKELWLFELTISFESRVEDARRRKRAKYHNLVEVGRATGYKSELITVEVGSQGMVGVSDFAALGNILDALKKELAAMTTQVIQIGL